jgi:hypothetical protein
MGTWSCFLTLVAAHPDAAVPCGQELGAPPVIRVRVYRSGGYSITSDQGGTHLIFFVNPSGSEIPRMFTNLLKLIARLSLGFFWDGQPDKSRQFPE